MTTPHPFANVLVEKLSKHLNGFVYQCRRSPNGHYTLPFVSHQLSAIFQLDIHLLAQDASSLFKLTHPEDVEHFVAATEKSARTMQPWQCEWRIIRPDEQVIWLRGNSTPEKEPDGSIVWTGYIENITNFKRLQAIAEISQIAMHGKQSKVPDLLIKLSESGICMLVHGVMQEATNEDFSTFEGQSIEVFLPQKICEVIYNSIQNCKKKNAPVTQIFSVDLLQAVSWFELSMTQEVQADNNLSSAYLVLIRDITKQINLDEKLLVNQVAFEHITQGIVLTGLDFKVISINQAFTNISGYALDDIKNKTLKFKQGPKTNKKSIKEINEALKAFKPFNGEILNYKKDGTTFWNALTITPVFDSEHKPQFFLGVIKDITELKEAEKQNRVAAKALQAISEAIMVTDQNKVILSVNDAFTKLTGFTNQEMLGKKARFFSRANNQDTINSIRHNMKTKVAYSGVVNSYKKDGSLFVNQLTITPVFDEEQQLTNFVGVIADITDRITLEAKLELSRKFLLTVIDAVPSCVFWKDVNGRYVGCNQAFADYLGLKHPKEIIGKTVNDFWPQRYAEQYIQFDNEVIKSGKDKLFYEEEGINAKGEKDWVKKSKVLLRDEHAKVIGLLGVMDVITESKLNQQKLLAVQQKLIETNDKYMDLYEFAPIGYMTLNEGGMIVEANWKARSMMGIKRKDLAKTRFNSVVVENNKRLWQSNFSSLISQVNSAEQTIELSIQGNQNKSIDLNLTCVRTAGANGQALIRVTMTDISEKAQALQALKQKEQYQRSLIDGFPFMVWLKDKQSRFLTVNQVFVDAAGAEDLNDILNKTDYDLWEPELAKLYIQNDQIVMAQKKSIFNDEMIKVDGQFKWFETYKSPVIVNNQVVGTVGFARDISDLKKSVMYEKFKSEMLELVVRELNLDLVFNQLARGVEKLNPEIFCIIALSKPDNSGFDVVAAPSLPNYVTDVFAKLKIAMGNGSIGTATFSKKRVIVNDVQTHPYWTNNKDIAKKAGIASSWAEPIIGLNGKVYGAFGMYTTKITNPNEDDIKLIEQAARLTSIAIERHQSISEIQNLAYYDVVTKLPNRRYFTELLSRLIQNTTKKSSFNALLYLGLDAFKLINESRGHEVGDILLLQVSQRLEKLNDGSIAFTIARMGNDEYAVLVEAIADDKNEAAKLVEKIAHKINKSIHRPFIIQKQKHHITASIGINVFGKASSKLSADEMLNQADIAMNQAKSIGGNIFCFFDPQMQTKITEQVSMEAEMRKAIKLNQFELHYQVQVDHTNRPFGAEALIRWRHPEKGMIPPFNFIPLAEETELILPIGEWVLETACAQIKQWQQSTLTRDLTLSVNISAVQFMQKNFVEMVKSSIKKHQIEPGALRLELTESMLLGNVEETVAHMNALGELGVQFSLDDFGTGYSSLQYLKRLPLYQLKIDRSFVNDIVNNTHDRTIVRTIIAMAQSMYIGVIAEGVESVEQKELLLSNGCRRYQGYYFGKPMPISELQVLLEQRLKPLE